MTAQIIQFPKAKKRGAKVRKGPLCEFHDIAPSPPKQTAIGVDKEAINRLVQKLEEAFNDPASKVGALLRRHSHEASIKNRVRLEKWRAKTIAELKESGPGADPA